MAVEVLGVILWDRRDFWRRGAFSTGAGACGVVLEPCPCVLCLDFPSQAIKARALLAWASPSVHQEGLEAAVSARSLTAWDY